MSTNNSHTVTAKETSVAAMKGLTANVGVIKTPPVLLKLFQTALGVVCLGLMIDSMEGNEEYMAKESGFLLLVVVTFFLNTALLLVSSIISNEAVTMIPKTIFEFLYHLTATAMYCASSISFALHVSKTEDGEEYSNDVSVAIMCIITTILYCASTYFSFKSYRSS